MPLNYTQWYGFLDKIQLIALAMQAVLSYLKNLAMTGCSHWITLSITTFNQAMTEWSHWVTHSVMVSRTRSNWLHSQCKKLHLIQEACLRRDGIIELHKFLDKILLIALAMQEASSHPINLAMTGWSHWITQRVMVSWTRCRADCTGKCKKLSVIHKTWLWQDKATGLHIAVWFLGDPANWTCDVRMVQCSIQAIKRDQFTISMSLDHHKSCNILKAIGLYIIGQA